MKQKTVKIDEDQYLELQRCFNEVLKNFAGVKQKINPEAWYDNQELMQVLFISKRTAQHYRDSGLISYSQVGNKIYYKGENIIALLEGNFKKNKF